MKYLKKFKTNSEYQTYINDRTALKPNVSYVTDDGEVFYNKLSRDYSTEYLTFEAVTSGTVTFMASSQSVEGKTISYSTDGGNTWTDLTTSMNAQTLATLSVGDKLLVKGENTVYASSVGTYNAFGGTAQVNVYGNIMSLIYGDNFMGQTTLDAAGFNLDGLFSNNSNLLSAENLVLHATTLTYGCYSGMF